jgi:hypothetical protein
MLWGIFLCSSVGIFLSLRNDHGWGDNFAGYILQAKAIANGSISSFITRSTWTINNSSSQLSASGSAKGKLYLPNIG